MKPTQHTHLIPSARRVLERLRLANGAWVRGIDLAHPDVGGLRFGGRIHEIRRAGYRIEDRPDPSGKTAVHQYRYVAEPEQLEMAI